MVPSDKSVKVTAPALVPPIVTPSIVPPLISVVVNTELANVTTPVVLAIEPAEVPSLAFKLVTSMLVVSTVVALTVVMLPVVAVAVVKLPATAVVPPMTVLSIVPALISAVSATRLSMFAVPSM